MLHWEILVHFVSWMHVLGQYYTFNMCHIRIWETLLFHLHTRSFLHADLFPQFHKLCTFYLYVFYNETLVDSTNSLKMYNVNILCYLQELYNIILYKENL